MIFEDFDYPSVHLIHIVIVLCSLSDKIKQEQTESLLLGARINGYGIHALSVHKKHLYKKQLVEFMKNKKRGLVRF